MSNSSRRHLANAVRALAMDGVQKANSGHPGAPMGMADIAEVLWNDYMKHNPTNPKWADRDRFILSNGHGSMLIYSLLHLTGYDLGIEDLKQFRQLHSRTPGHPEYGYAPGVETTTGPLGQGITNGVGMALAEKTLAAQFNKPGHTIVDHNTYVFLGDGCLMEGISHEACSLAGTLGLGKLIAFWDDNGISIDGHVEGWFTDDTPGRFEAYGWQVIRGVDGHDAEEIKQAIETAKAETGKPTMICCKTVIGFGSPNLAGTHDCHGAALGHDEIALVRKELGWDAAPFEIPADVYAGWDAKAAGASAEADWDARFAAYTAEFPAEAAEYTRRINSELSANWEADADAFIAAVNAKGETIASRKASQNAIEGLAKITPEFLGGSADLAGSNLTLWSGAKPVIKDPAGNYVNYGVREFGMAAMINGIALHGGFVPYGATFLMFSEYARNALRMAALMKVRHIEVFTHDSIGLGEDGPTHQPVEQTATLRMIPNMDVWRPCDAVESAVSWKSAIMNQTGPSSLIFSRQNLPHQVRTAEQIKLIERGGYILKDCAGTPDAIIIATGSEVSLAMEAAAKLTGKKIRVVSMPSTNTFDKQDAAYKESVLPKAVSARVAVEAGVTGFWAKYVGLNGKTIGIDTFGESAPAGELFKLFGITTDAVVAAVNEIA
ncbi:MAG: transketolase [Zetaproteobacteria bacterium CG_4_9_14_3_um_filter_53_7]|nr:MAG: transketolase [Zetaproteobacteria bacterium CG_4_9_14_3_um_filter_53_7]